MHLLVVTDRELPADWLRQAVRGRASVSHCAPGPASAITAQAARAGAQVALVDFGRRDAAAAAAQVRDLCHENGRLLVVGIGEDDAPETVLAAVRAGARDYLRIGSSADEIEALLERLGAQAQASAGQRCRWFAVLGARPGENTTLLATHLALALREAEPDGRVLLLDVGLPAGDAPLMLGLAAEYTAADALRSVRRLDETLIDTAIARHRSGLHLLSLPPDLPPPALTGADLLELGGVLGAHCAAVLVNLGGWTDADVLRAALRLTERALLVVEATVPSCRSARALLDRLHQERIATEALGVVVDGTYRGMQMTPAEVAQGLALPLWAELPASTPARHLALNRGASLYGLRPRDPYPVRTRELAAALHAAALHGGAQARVPVRGARERLLGLVAPLRGLTR
jgi:pilus assembly protein CpaE